MLDRPRPIGRVIAVIAVAALCLMAPETLAAQDLAPARVKSDASPCCGIVRIYLERSIIMARDLSTGYTFLVAVKSRKVLARLKVGDKVWVDFATKRARVAAGDSLCCPVLAAPAVPEAP